jgi:hypothetical protein
MHAKILFFRQSTILNCKKNKISILTQAGEEVMPLEGAVGGVVALLGAGQLPQLQ